MEKWHLCSWNMKSVETQLGKEREIRKKITNHLIIRQLMNILILDCPLQVCRKDSYWKKKSADFSMLLWEWAMAAGKKSVLEQRTALTFVPGGQSLQSTFISVIFVSTPWLVPGSPAPSPSLFLLQDSCTWNTTLQPAHHLALPCAPADGCLHTHLPWCVSAPGLDCFSWLFLLIP